MIKNISGAATAVGVCVLVGIKIWRLCRERREVLEDRLNLIERGLGELLERQPRVNRLYQ